MNPSLAESPVEWHLLVPGALDQRTGGYLYDARITRELQAAGWRIVVHELPGRFPLPDTRAARGLEAALTGLSSGEMVIMDGLAAGALPGIVERHRTRLRMIALVHHALGDETGLSPAVRDHLLASEQRVLAACKGCIVTSAHTRRRLAELGVPAERIRVVVPGTELVNPPVRRSESTPVVLCVATLSPRKGQHLLVEALAGLKDIPWRCCLVGSTERDPEYTGRIRAMIHAHGLDDRIVIAGEVGDHALAVHYGSADLFVLPSYHEGYGMALTEALAWGLPVVATTGGAIPETVPEEAALLTAPGDLNALAEALHRCVINPALRETLGRAALEHVRSLPDWQQSARQFAQAVEELA